MVPAGSRAPDGGRPTASSGQRVADLEIVAGQGTMSVAASRIVTVASLNEYREGIDVRSPAEYAEDHLPDAANHPVLNDEERARIGTMHAQASGFAAKRVGAAIVARNIATMLETVFADK